VQTCSSITERLSLLLVLASAGVAPSLRPPYLFPLLYSCAFGCLFFFSYRDSKGQLYQTSCIVGVLHASANHITQPNRLAPPWTQFVETSLSSPQASQLLDSCAPSLGVHPFPYVDCSDSPWVCRWGCQTSPVRSSCQGKTGTWSCSKISLPFPKRNRTLHRLSQGTKGVSPVGLACHHRSPRCSCPRPQ
jgi:hypothetical protein